MYIMFFAPVRKRSNQKAKSSTNLVFSRTMKKAIDFNQDRYHNRCVDYDSTLTMLIFLNMHAWSKPIS